MHYEAGEWQWALHYYQQALALAEAVGDRSGQAANLINMGVAYMKLGEMGWALACHEQSLSIQQAIGGRGWQASTLNNLGMLYDGLGEMGWALEYYKQAEGIREAIGDRVGLRTVLYNMAKTYRKWGNLAVAERLLERVVALDVTLEFSDQKKDHAFLLEVRAERDAQQEMLPEAQRDNVPAH